MSEEITAIAGHERVLADLIDAIDPDTDYETRVELMVDMTAHPDVAVAASVSLLWEVMRLLHSDGTGRGQRLMASLREKAAAAL